MKLALLPIIAIAASLIAGCVTIVRHVAVVQSATVSNLNDEEFADWATRLNGEIGFDFYRRFADRPNYIGFDTGILFANPSENSRLPQWMNLAYLIDSRELVVTYAGVHKKKTSEIEEALEIIEASVQKIASQVSITDWSLSERQYSDLAIF